MDLCVAYRHFYLQTKWKIAKLTRFRLSGYAVKLLQCMELLIRNPFKRFLKQPLPKYWGKSLSMMKFETSDRSAHLILQFFAKIVINGNIKSRKQISFRLSTLLEVKIQAQNNTKIEVRFQNAVSEVTFVTLRYHFETKPEFLTKTSLCPGDARSYFNVS